MKASELIERLNTLIAEHGDLEVRPRDAEFIFDTFAIEQVKIATDEFYGVNLANPAVGKFIVLDFEEAK